MTALEKFLEQIILKRAEGYVYLLPAITDIQIDAALKEEKEALQAVKEDKPECPTCGSDNIAVLTGDLDWCITCGAQIDAIITSKPKEDKPETDKKECADCKGSGEFCYNSENCHACNECDGTGYVVEQPREDRLQEDQNVFNPLDYKCADCGHFGCLGECNLKGYEGQKVEQ